MVTGLLGFALVGAVLVLTPGPDFAVVLPSALRSRRAGIATAAGTASGLALHAAVAALGLSAVLQTSAVAFTVTKVVGAVFLVTLGLRALWTSRRGPRPAPGAAGPAGLPAGAEPAGPPLRLRSAYLRGLLVNVLNPKAPVIYLSVMPQFVQPGHPVTAQLAAMSAVLVALALAWYVLLSLLVQPIRATVLRVRHWIDRASGTALLLLGLRLALTPRPA